VSLLGIAASGERPNLYTRVHFNDGQFGRCTIRGPVHELLIININKCPTCLRYAVAAIYARLADDLEVFNKTI
jgi:hypothetical protein